MSSPAARRPESVLVVIYTPERRCLLLERVHPPGFWQSVTGALGWDETPEAAAVREVLEETGLNPQDLEDAGIERRFPILPAWRSRYAPDEHENGEYFFYMQVGRPCSITLNRDEHLAYRWLELEEALAMASSWTNREALERLRP